MFGLETDQWGDRTHAQNRTNWHCCELWEKASYSTPQSLSEQEDITDRQIYEDKYFVVSSPEHPLNCREDGGHLVLVKKEKVTDRSDMTYQEAIDFMRISMMVGKAMYQVLRVERVNYEDLGNWGLDDPGGAKMHLHIFGRAKEQTHQIRGQHMFLYPKGHKIFRGHLKPFTKDQIKKLTAKIEEISHEEKYMRMAGLAGLSTLH